MSRKIVKELVMKDVTPARGGDEQWCGFEELCLETQSKVEGMKMMARWVTAAASCPCFLSLPPAPA